MNPLVKTGGLAVNADAQKLHELGLKHEGQGLYDEAHSFFQGALEQLNQSGDISPDAIIQSTHINRDDAFTHLRQAVVKPNKGKLDHARAMLRQSVSRSAPFVDGTQVGVEQHLATKKARRAAFAQHAMTLGMLARQGTVRQFLFKEANNDDQAYGLAHEFARIGSNGYGRVSNAMNAARHERVSGRAANVMPWVGRAAVGTSWTLFRNPKNFLSASRTFARLTWNIRSRSAADRAVKSRP